MKHLLLLVLAALPALPAAAAAQSPDARAVEAHVARGRAAIVGELVELLRIPNVAADTANIRRNAEALVAMMERRGIRTRVLEEGGAPMLYGELPAEGASTTLLFYAHYDGQPADPASWTGHAPWTPVLRTGRLGKPGVERIDFPAEGPYRADWRIYARSASDDKAPIVALLAALDALEATGRRPTVNLKFLFEGDEEAGSPSMERVVRTHGELLAADLVVVIDGPEHASRRPTVNFGVRGITTARLVAYGPGRPLHSGHYGNWAPNPAMELARLLASMKDDDGRVLVEGWYDDVVPLSGAERAAIRALPAEAPADYGFAVPEGGADALRFERIALPSLNVRGLRSAWVGAEARTIVPDSAVAELDLRLVPDVRPEQQVERLVAHIRAQGWHVVDEAPDAATRAKHARIVRVDAREGGYAAVRTRFDHPVARRVVAALERATGERPVVIPTMGGSVPMAWFPEIAGTDVVFLPTVNPDNNQHSPDENLRLGNLFRAVVAFAGVMRLEPEGAKAAR